MRVQVLSTLSVLVWADYPTGEFMREDGKVIGSEIVHKMYEFVQIFIHCVTMSHSHVHNFMHRSYSRLEYTTATSTVR